jgi:stress responsive alpha/beta barrel protein
VIVHVVLFRPRPDLSMNDRRALIDSWATALREIPSISRAHVGPRIRVGRPYEELSRTDFPYAAILEFDHIDALRAYLDHPAHEDISTRFFAAIADTLIYDFDVEGSADGLRGMLEPESESC